MTTTSTNRKVRNYVFDEIRNGLKPIYSYHSLSHTTMVLRDATFIASKMNIDNNDLNLLQIAIYLHDMGFIKNHENHEETGCEIARHILPGFNISHAEIERICGLIMATKIPQTPTNTLERIICDADLYYLGTDYYFQVADLFKRELTQLGVLQNAKQWRDIQIGFVEKHHYHTAVANKLLEAKKQLNLDVLKCSI